MYTVKHGDRYTQMVNSIRKLLLGARFERKKSNERNKSPGRNSGRTSPAYNNNNRKSPESSLPNTRQRTNITTTIEMPKYLSVTKAV